MHVTFRTVFEAAPPEQALIWFPVLGLACVLIGLLMVLEPQACVSRVLPGVRVSWARAVSWIWLVSWSIWTFATLPAASQWRSISQSQPVLVVEGPVANFVREPYNGPSHGTFTVAGKQFAFPGWAGKPMFVEGSIANGTYTRVTFREQPINRITVLRLEVAGSSQ
ncbi:hypothetical protein ACVWWO_009587 [Bradyrhizobium sp. F1.13.1]